MQWSSMREAALSKLVSAPRLAVGSQRTKFGEGTTVAAPSAVQIARLLESLVVWFSHWYDRTSGTILHVVVFIRLHTPLLCSKPGGECRHRSELVTCHYFSYPDVSFVRVGSLRYERNR